MVSIEYRKAGKQTRGVRKISASPTHALPNQYLRAHEKQLLGFVKGIELVLLNIAKHENTETNKKKQRSRHTQLKQTYNLVVLALIVGLSKQDILPECGIANPCLLRHIGHAAADHDRALALHHVANQRRD